MLINLILFGNTFPVMLSLKANFYNVTPFMIIKSTGKLYSGIEFDLIETLANHFNFSMEYEVAKLVNGTRFHLEK